MKQIVTRFVYEDAEHLYQACKRICEQYNDLKVVFAKRTEECVPCGHTCFLVLTDDCQTALYCAERSIPYLVVLHEKNAFDSFPSGAFCIEKIEDISMSYLEKIVQRFRKIPWTILETGRLVVREITVEDVPALYELYRDPEITEFMEDLFADPSEEIAYTRQYIENVYSFYGYGMWLVLEKETGEIVGRAGVESKEGFDGLELGFMIGKRYQRRGYAFEVCKAIINYVQEELEIFEFCALVREGNIASAALCKKLGMQEEGKRIVQEKMSSQEYIQYVWKRQ